MAIIKCPECGRQVSDKAPVCPNCGVEIAGKIIRCPQCGETYFSNLARCPKCQHPTHAPEQAVGEGTEQRVRKEEPPIHEDPATDNQRDTADTAKPVRQKSGKGKTIALIVSLCIALVIGGVCFYFYNDAKAAKENEAFAFAIESDEPMVLQNYLDNNPDAPADHRESITARLEFLKKQDNDWTNALVSGSRTALEDYLAKHPDSEHSLEARHKMDSIDWADAARENTVEAMQLYLTRHANGEHVDEANATIKEIKTKTIQDEDRKIVALSLRRFFLGLSAGDGKMLMASVTPILSNFLGKTDATQADVVTFMNKIYKEDVIGMDWRTNNDYQITKKEVGDEQYEYTVNFSAIQKIERTDQSKEKEAHYQIKATINPDGLISAMSMTKILE